MKLLSYTSSRFGGTKLYIFLNIGNVEVCEVVD